MLVLLVHVAAVASTEAGIGSGRYGSFDVTGYWQDALFPGLIRDGKVWEAHIAAALAKLLKPGDTFVDAGGNLGVHTLLGGTLVGAAGSVHVFEAHPLNVRMLRQNIRRNGLDFVQLHAAALGAAATVMCMPGRRELDANGRSFNAKRRGNVLHMDFSVTPRNTGDLRCRGVDVPVVALDSLKLPRLDVVKLDIQGSEQEALRGMEATIRIHQPLIIFEMEEAQLTRHNASSNTLVALLHERNYAVYLLAEKYPADHIAVPHPKVAAFREAVGEGAFGPLCVGSRANFNIEAGVRESVCLPTPDIPCMRPLQQKVECALHPAYTRPEGNPLPEWAIHPRPSRMGPARCGRAIHDA